MAEELQNLLDKIYSEGVKKADSEAEKIISAAKKEAKEILAGAKIEADAIRARAQEAADSLQQRAESAVRQASRDILLQLKAELEKRLRAAVAGAAKEALTPQLMAQIISGFAKADPDAEISALCSGRDVEALQEALYASLGKSFASQPKVFADASIEGGLEVSLRDGEFFFDFTVPAVTELVGELVGDRIAALLEK